MYRILLDTNVLVDYLLGRNPGCNACKRIITLSAEGQHALYAASSSLKDVYHLIEASLKRAQRTQAGGLTDAQANAAAEVAWACTRQLLDTLLVVSVGREECLQAFTLRSLHNDFEDNLVVAAARAAQANFLVTGDAKLRDHAPVGCLSPGDMATLLEAELNTPGSPHLAG